MSAVYVNETIHCDSFAECSFMLIVFAKNANFYKRYLSDSCRLSTWLRANCWFLCLYINKLVRTLWVHYIHLSSTLYCARCSCHW